MQTTTRALVRLGESDTTLARPEDDIRGRTLVDTNGEELGTVDDLFIEPETGKTRFLLVGQGGILGLGKKQFLIPSDAVSYVDDGRVQVRKTAEQMGQAPEYDRSMGDDQVFETAYVFWGVTPYWSPDYVERDRWPTAASSR